MDLQYTEVRAPITGRIGRALITEGALVAIGGSESLATIQQLEPIYADFTQSSNALLALKRTAQETANGRRADEAEVRLRFDDGSEYPHQGRLLFSEASVDATTGQITLRGEFPNPDGDLLPGMYVRIQIVQGEQANALAVPERALQRDPGGQAQLYVVGDDRKVELRSVTPGRLVNGRRVIGSGLNAGDTVVVEGFQTLSAGAVVEAEPWKSADDDGRRRRPAARELRSNPMSDFFIARPIFAWVVAIFIMIAGALAIPNLPIAQYPNVAPPQISVYDQLSRRVVGGDLSGRDAADRG